MSTTRSIAKRPHAAPPYRRGQSVRAHRGGAWIALRATRRRSIRRVREPTLQPPIPPIDWHAIAPTLALTLLATILALLAVLVLLPMVLVLADVPYR